MGQIFFFAVLNQQNEFVGVVIAQDAMEAWNKLPVGCYARQLEGDFIQGLLPIYLPHERKESFIPTLPHER